MLCCIGVQYKICFGIRILGYQIQRKGDRGSALEAYNGGGDPDYVDDVRYNMKHKEKEK